MKHALGVKRRSDHAEITAARGEIRRLGFVEPHQRSESAVACRHDMALGCASVLGNCVGTMPAPLRVLIFCTFCLLGNAVAVDPADLLPPPTSAPATQAARWDRVVDKTSFGWRVIERMAARAGPNQAMAKLLLAARAEGAPPRRTL